MTRFDPFREIEQLSQRVNTFAVAAPARFAPNVDIFEDEQGLEIGLDLPGVKAEDVHVEAENNTLSVQAERRLEPREGRNAHRVERAYGTFSRSFSVPPRYDLGRVQARFDNGALTLSIPRSEAALKRTVTVTSGQGAAQTEPPAGQA